MSADLSPESNAGHSAARADLLHATALRVTHGERVLVSGAEVTVRAGETTAIVGESGSGKSLTARAIVGLLPDGLRASGSLAVGGSTYDLTASGPQLSTRWRALRRRHVALLLQDPFASLSPVHTIGRQVGWALGSRDPEKIAARLAEVGLDARVAAQYPHELSGGMRQRVSIVLTLAQDPEVLIADEPTTALDSLTQADILQLLDRLKAERRLGVILISHDLDVVARHSQEVVVMRLGDVVERGRTASVLTDPQHDYTRALLAAVPRPGAGRGRPAEPVVAVRGAVHHHGVQQTLHEVSLTVRRGEIVGLIGQSGSGKTTLARCIAGLEPLDAGSVDWSGERRLGMVFQDPAGTLNPALSIRTTLREALAPHPTSPHTPESLMALVGLDAALLTRRPARLSGGQRQRVAIARALAGRPSLLICDEAVSALDVSVQAQILALLTRLRDEEGVSILFITHDLGVVAQISDRVYVLNEGAVVETGDTAEVVASPRDPYTRRLLAASSLVGGGADAMSWLTSAAHGRWLEGETDRLLAFGAAARHPDGFAWLDDAGRPDPEHPVELWITARMTHVYALAHLLGRPGAGALADHGVAALAGAFHDDTHGGWYGALGPGAVEAKTAYEHAFVLLAASSATAAGRPGAAALLSDALAIHDRFFWDEAAGAVVEEWDRTFTRLDGYRGANANMHTVEALLAVADVLVADAPRLRERALRITTRIVHEQAAANGWRIPEHYTDDWQPVLDLNRDQPAHPFRPYGATVGHAFEWARLCLHLAAALSEHAPGWLVQDARSLFATAVADGWSVDGADGFVYTVDWDGTPVVRERMHWVVGEAIAAAAALHRATGADGYAEQYEAWWEYAAEHVLDPAGSWHHELDASNRPASGTWQGKPDIYHAVQATLLPRVPLAPGLAVALRDGLLR